jgi:hypothetical protein
MSKPIHILLNVFGVACIATAVGLLGSDKVTGNAIAINSAFTGLLTLTGFMFTARTFITFKLNEAVYGVESYQKHVEALQRDGAYSLELYEPLKELDTTLGKTCLYCFGTLFAVVLFSMIPRDFGAGDSLWSRIMARCAAGDAVPSDTEQLPFSFVVYQVLTVLAYSALLSAIVNVFDAIFRVNRNIRGIINEWEKKYKAERDKRNGAPRPEA